MSHFSWPNAISILRLPLAAAFLVSEAFATRGVILAVGAISDWLDGWLARRLGQKTPFGEILDPLTDRIFILAAFASFALSGQLSLGQLLILLSRDLFTGAAFVAASAFRLPVRFKARGGGKAVTVLQIVAVLTLLVRPEWIGALVVVVGIASAYAIVDYTHVGLRALQRRHGNR